MKLKFDEKTLKKLDKYNLFQLLEKASLGNLARGCGWMAEKTAKAWKGISKLSEVNTKENGKSTEAEAENMETEDTGSTKDSNAENSGSGDEAKTNE